MKNKTEILSNIFVRWMWTVWIEGEILLKFISQRAYKRVNIMLNSVMYRQYKRQQKRTTASIHQHTLWPTILWLDPIFTGFCSKETLKQITWEGSREEALESAIGQAKQDIFHGTMGVCVSTCVCTYRCAHREQTPLKLPCILFSNSRSLENHTQLNISKNNSCVLQLFKKLSFLK